MARSVNKVILIGNLGKDPDTRYMPSGMATTTITVATTRVSKDKQSGENTEYTDWHEVVLFSRLAEIASEYLKKGSKVYIEGNLRTNKWQDDNNQTHYRTQVIANDLVLLTSKGSGSNDFTPTGSQTAITSQADSMASLENGDDDIPF